MDIYEIRVRLLGNFQEFDANLENASKFAFLTNELGFLQSTNIEQVFDGKGFIQKNRLQYINDNEKVFIQLNSNMLEILFFMKDNKSFFDLDEKILFTHKIIRSFIENVELKGNRLAVLAKGILKSDDLSKYVSERILKRDLLVSVSQSSYESQVKLGTQTYKTNIISTLEFNKRKRVYNFNNTAYETTNPDLLLEVNTKTDNRYHSTFDFNLLLNFIDYAKSKLNTIVVGLDE